MRRLTILHEAAVRLQYISTLLVSVVSWLAPQISVCSLCVLYRASKTTPRSRPSVRRSNAIWFRHRAVSSATTVMSLQYVIITSRGGRMTVYWGYMTESIRERVNASVRVWGPSGWPCCSDWRRPRCCGMSWQHPFPLLRCRNDSATWQIINPSTSEMTSRTVGSPGNWLKSTKRLNALKYRVTGRTSSVTKSCCDVCTVRLLRYTMDVNR